MGRISRAPIEGSNEQRYIEAVANKLQEMGFKAEADHTGGGIFCIYIECGAELHCWGTANETWGADRHNAEGEYLEGSYPIEIDCPSGAPAVEAAIAIAAYYRPREYAPSDTFKAAFKAWTAAGIALVDAWQAEECDRHGFLIWHGYPFSESFDEVIARCAGASITFNAH